MVRPLVSGDLQRSPVVHLGFTCCFLSKIINLLSALFMLSRYLSHQVFYKQIHLPKQNSKRGRKTSGRVSTRRNPQHAQTVQTCFDPGAAYPGRQLIDYQKPMCTTWFRQELTNFNTSNASEVAVGYNIALSQFPNYTNWVAIFDEYRFEELEVWIIPAITESSSGTGFQGGRYVTSIDLDNSASLSSYSAHLMTDGSVVSGILAGRYMRFAPCVTGAAYVGASVTGYTNAGRPWLDTAVATVSHYGFKATSTATATAVNMTIEVRAKVSFRGSRLV